MGASPEDRSADGEFRREVAAIAREVMLARGADPSGLPAPVSPSAPGPVRSAGPSPAGADTGHAPQLDPDYLQVRTTTSFLVTDAARLVRSHVRSVGSPAEVGVLLAVARFGTATSRQVSASSGLPSSTLSTVVGRLQSAGLLTRRPSRSDGRTSVLEIPGPGRARAERAAATYRGVDDLLLTELAPGERAELGRLLRGAMAALATPGRSS